MNLGNPLEKVTKPQFEEELVDFPARTINPDAIIAEGTPEEYTVLIKQMRNNPEKIVKISTKENIYRFSPRSNPVESPNSLSVQEKSKKHYEELNNKYGIAVTSFEYKIGMDEEKKESILYSISDKIHGDNLLSKIKELKPEENVKEVENFLIALINYFEDKFYNDNYCLGDVGNLSNYMYGHRKDEIKDKIYLVDIEPVLNEIDGPKKKKVFFRRLERVLGPQIRYVEKAMGADLSSIHERYSNFINHIKQNR